MTKTVCVTGATGVMGSETVKQLLNLKDIKIRMLVLPYPSEKKKAQKLIGKNENIEAIYGDLRNYEEVLNFINGADYVLHIGGMVSPIADDKPQETYDVNVHGAENVVNAIKTQKNKDDIKVVYIGSVAETGDRNYPIHWGRTGDPIKVSLYDHYGLSKVLAERVFAESGLKHWAVFRQSGILHSGLLNNMKPIMYHVPLNGVLEWCTVEDSGRLMKNIVDFELPDEFWRRFYNIGSGEFYRLTNYEFEDLILRTAGIGSIKDITQPNWFATKNFHGHYYADSDVLEGYLKFRENIPTEEYFEQLLSKADLSFKLIKASRFVKNVSFMAKPFMKMIANDKNFGTLGWIKNNDMARIKSSFGSIEEFNKLETSWSQFPIKHYETSIKNAEKYIISHGYDETKPFDSLTIDDLKAAAAFRGGCLVSEYVDSIYEKVTWKCGHCGKEFEATPNLILKGGHWCPHCFIPSNAWDYGRIAEKNQFFAQVWYNNHTKDEKDYYEFETLFDKEYFDTYKKVAQKSKNITFISFLVMFFVILVIFAALSVYFYSNTITL